MTNFRGTRKNISFGQYDQDIVEFLESEEVGNISAFIKKLIRDYMAGVSTPPQAPKTLQDSEIEEKKEQKEKANKFIRKNSLQEQVEEHSNDTVYIEKLTDFKKELEKKEDPVVEKALDLL